LNDLVVMATGVAISPAPACTLCKDECDDDNAIKCSVCASSVHVHCLIKHGRDKATKKVQGASPTWLHDVLRAAGMRYFCQTCLPTFDPKARTDSTAVAPSLTDLSTKVSALDSKVDLILSSLLDSQTSDATGGTATTSTSNPSLAEILRSNVAPTKDMLKDVVTEAIRSNDAKIMQSTSVVLLGVHEGRSDVAIVRDILHEIDCECTVTKTQRLGKHLVHTTDASSTDRPKVRPLLITLSNELERNIILRNAKSLAGSRFKEVFVRKWLSKEEKEADNILRAKCKNVNSISGRLINGKNSFVVVNGHIRERKDDGSIDYRKSVDVESLLRSRSAVTGANAPSSSK